MAKGNMLQGMARGKVGDVVFSRLNGEQIARVRNRNPKNPKTNAQLYQRAIMATVMQAYSAGRAIFDHSFEGFSVGEGNQRRFMSVNAKRLRASLANDLKLIAEGGQESSLSLNSYCAPGVQYPSFALLQCSEGHYDNKQLDALTGMPSPEADEKVNQYVSRIGLKAGDIFTIVGFAKPQDNRVIFDVTTTDVTAGSQYASYFFFLRLRVKAGLDAIATAITATTPLKTLFEVTSTFNCSFLDTALIQPETTNETMIDIVCDVPGGCVVGGVIRSRTDEDLRSSSFLVYNGNSVEYSDNLYGISAKYLLDAWKQGSERVGDSDLILEGGDQ